MAQSLTHQSLSDTFSEQTLFHEKAWRLTPSPFALRAEQVQTIQAIGQACFQFYKALNILYHKSKQNQSILRNKTHLVPWVANYYDLGKAAHFIHHNSNGIHKRTTTPNVIRPDLLITENGFALTELDCVPGGVGLTAFLNELYSGKQPVSSAMGMAEAFYQSIKSGSDKANPEIAVVISDEAATYKPEFIWLTEQLQRKGYKIHCIHPSELEPKTDGLYSKKTEQKIDILYRFFELFDWPNVPNANAIMEAAQNGLVAVTPPILTYQEEKLSLALFHHHALEDFWQENLSKADYELLMSIIPKSWILDPAPLPPAAILNAPLVNGRSIYSWQQLAEASQKERNWILKISGFDDNSWGARSVVYGSDCSKQEWEKALEHALKEADHVYHILQEYHKPITCEHPVYDPSGNLTQQKGRVRLCPYYFVNNNAVELQGILCTFCPADKKIIHGMKDACLMPCSVEE